MIFKKRKKKNEKKSVGAVSKAAVWVHNKILFVAGYLNKKINALSIEKIKWGLLVFCLLSASLSAYTGYQAFQKKRESKLIIQPIRIPAPIEQGMIQKDKEWMRQEYLKIKNFQNYIQQLTKKNPQKADSLLRLRPGLMDSVQTILELYKTQLNN